MNNNLDVIFKSYDIRGVFGDTLSLQDAYKIGYSFAKFVDSEKILIGVVISYYLSRRIIIKFSFSGGKLKEFLNFTYTNLISLFAPNLIWFIINFVNDALQKDELWFLAITILIN